MRRANTSLPGRAGLRWNCGASSSFSLRSSFNELLCGPTGVLCLSPSPSPTRARLHARPPEDRGTIRTDPYLYTCPYTGLCRCLHTCRCSCRFTGTIRTEHTGVVRRALLCPRLGRAIPGARLSMAHAPTSAHWATEAVVDQGHNYTGNRIPNACFSAYASQCIKCVWADLQHHCIRSRDRHNCAVCACARTRECIFFCMCIHVPLSGDFFDRACPCRRSPGI